MEIKEFDCVRLKDGRKGTIIEVYDNEFLIEFSDDEGKTTELIELPKDQIDEIIYIA